MDKEEAIYVLEYFHTEKGDMTRYCNYDEAIKLFPNIERAFNDYKYYSKILDSMIKTEMDKYSGT